MHKFYIIVALVYATAWIAAAGPPKPVLLSLDSDSSSDSGLDLTEPSKPAPGQSLLVGRTLTRTKTSSVQLFSLDDSSSTDEDAEDDDEDGGITISTQRKRFGMSIAVAEPAFSPSRVRERHHPVPIPPSSYRPILRHSEPTVKKSLKFADDCGSDLTRVREFSTDDSDDEEDFVVWEYNSEERAPKLDDCLILDVSRWQLNFAQPEADYVVFREKLSISNVALQKVVVNAQCSSFTGTIKVKNVAGEGEVWIRYSSDNWSSFKQMLAHYSEQTLAGPSERKTFVFEIVLPEPSKTHVMEFYISLETAGDAEEVWDDNNGKNYQLVYS